MKKQPVQAKAAEPTKEKAAKSTEKKPSETKEKKSDGQKPAEAKAKAPSSNNPAPAKTYFTAGAQGDDEHSYRTLDTLISLFEQAIRKAFPEDPTYPVLVVPGKQTDYQCNSAMPIAQVRSVLIVGKFSL